MDCLLSVFDGDAKRSIQSIGSSGILRNFDQNFKITITQLKSIGYEVPIKANENSAKALLCLPYMRNEFYKVTCNLEILDGDPNLIFLEKYLAFEKYFLKNAS